VVDDCNENGHGNDDIAEARLGIVVAKDRVEVLCSLPGKAAVVVAVVEESYR